MPEPARLSVVGSLNLDLVARVPRLPRDGETLLAHGYDRALGGKGANQAVSAARHGVTAAMVGCVGDDPDGRRLTDALAAEGIDVTGVRVRTDAPTGVAHIAVDADGANSIIVAPGANGLLGPDDVQRELDRLPPADIVLIQLEVPLDAAIAAAATTGARIVLNPAPARPLPAELLQHVDVLVPNLPELAVLTGGGAPTTIEEVAERGRGLADGRAVVVTLGERGALLLDAHGRPTSPPPRSTRSTPPAPGTPSVEASPPSSPAAARYSTQCATPCMSGHCRPRATARSRPSPLSRSAPSPRPRAG